jgi:Domain of unknown function (DUF5615)
MLRFHLDEHIDPAIADGLRRRGIDVTTTARAGLRGARDKDHVEFARAQGRVVVTQDPDFLRDSSLISTRSKGIGHTNPKRQRGMQQFACGKEEGASLTLRVGIRCNSRNSHRSKRAEARGGDR